MICTSEEEAIKVAETGALRMAGEGYKAIQSAANLSVWRCYKPDGVTFYRVELGPRMPQQCACAFFRSNRRYRVCKHIVYCRWEAAAQAYCREHGLHIPGYTCSPSNFAVSSGSLDTVRSNATIARI